MSQDNKRNFILHGSILAMAGIFVRIIGMVYRIPVLNIIGSEGNGIYVTAYNVYNIILVLSSYGLPMAVSKLISARFTKRRYKNAAKVLRCSLTVGAFTGGVAALLVYFGADFIENVIYGGGVPGLAIPLRVLAPTIFIVALLGVLRGFFQGQGTMIPTAVSQIIEQLVNAGVSIAAGYMLMKHTVVLLMLLLMERQEVHLVQLWVLLLHLYSLYFCILYTDLHLCVWLLKIRVLQGRILTGAFIRQL